MFKLFKKKSARVAEEIKPDFIITAADAVLLTEKGKPERKKEEQEREDRHFSTLLEHIKKQAERGEYYSYASCYVHVVSDSLCKRFTDLGYIFLPSVFTTDGKSFTNVRGIISWKTQKDNV
jgi:hypothetical protein